MKRLWALVFGGLLTASAGWATAYWSIEVRGGSRLYSLDKPVSKGRVFLFHRYPDGVYMSLAAGEVVRVDTLSEAPAPDRLAPGQTVYVGPPLSGAGAAPRAAAGPVAPPPDSMAGDSAYYGDYGYSGWGWGGGGYVPPPRPPGPVPPSRIGPNGFPILAPPGSPGSTPPPIGANGYPILAPAPPVVAPRRPQ